MILGSPHPVASGQVRATVTNVGTGRAHDVTIRKVWHQGLGPSLATADVVDPEWEIAVEVDLTAAERRDCGLSVEWQERGRRVRQHVPFCSLAH